MCNLRILQNKYGILFAFAFRCTLLLSTTRLSLAAIENLCTYLIWLGQIIPKICFADCKCLYYNHYLQRYGDFHTARYLFAYGIYALLSPRKDSSRYIYLCMHLSTSNFKMFFDFSVLPQNKNKVFNIRFRKKMFKLILQNMALKHQGF